MKQLLKFILFALFILGVSLWAIWFNSRMVVEPVNTPVNSTEVETPPYDITWEK